MASMPDSITPNQLKLARIALWHQNGDALRTMDDARTWLDAAGLVPYYPHAQFAASPQPSFAEAILGRPETGWVPQAAGSPSEDESYAVAVEEEESDEDFEEESDEAFDDEEESDEDSEEDDEEEGDDEESKGWSPEAADDEVMLTNGDQIAEDEGDEIAEEDRMDAEGNPLPNDLVAAEAADAAHVEPKPEAEPINGFSAEEKETVSHMLARMIAEGSAVPLNLLGSTTGEPDFVCSSQAFSFVYTLRGDKNWKQEPAQTGSMRVSPLAVKVYEALKEKGAMAPHELSSELGQGVVDSAILRALSELWAIQRVIPVPDPAGEPAKWELMSGRFVRHLKAGANAGQPTALSALLSLYLSQAVAATSDEMEIFLSPLAARSRVREVVGGLSASRQLESTVVNGKTLLYIPGALDHLPADVKDASAFTAAPRSRYEDDDRRHMIEERAARFAAEGGAPERRPARTGSYPVRRPAAAGDRPAPRREGGFAPRREGGFAPQRRSGGFAGGDRERRPFTRPDNASAPSDSQRNEFARPWDQDRKPFTPREGGERPPFTPRGDGERRPFTPREGRPPFGDRKPFTPREGGERRPFAPRGDGERRPFTPREGRPSFGNRKPFTPREGRPSFGDRKPFTPREGGERPPFTPRGDGDRRPFTPLEGGERRPFTPRGDRPFPPREGGGERRPFPPREGGDRKPFAPRGDRPFPPRGDGERRPFTPREGGERRPFTPRGDRPFTPREGGGERRPFTPREGGDRKPFVPRGDRPFTPREGGRPAFGDRKPFAPREGGERRPFTPREGGERRPFTPREGARPSFGARPAFGDRKPSFGGPRKPFGADRGGSSEGRPSRDRFSGEPGEGRPAFRSGAGSAGPGGAKFGGSGFGRDRSGAPGGFGRPGAFPARRGPGSGPGRGGAPKRRSE